MSRPLVKFLDGRERSVCLRLEDHPGIKVIILYPLNSLAADQRGRLVPTANTAKNAAMSVVKLAESLREQVGFAIHQTYYPDRAELAELRPKRIRLSKRDAEVLGVAEHCTMADLLAETDVRWSDADHPEGRPVRLVGVRYTDPGLYPLMERVYPTPWTRCDREADYRQAWGEFERRLGT
ncbi:MAG TPA: hypothetical protein VEB21_07965 [Terriglobales bacterium]|nr:hypothetical protein [Terriglobales bacterium]